MRDVCLYMFTFRHFSVQVLIYECIRVCYYELLHVLEHAYYASFSFNRQKELKDIAYP